MRNMVETNMVEEIDGGNNFFDQIDDLLEFPSDDVDTAFFGSGAAVDCTAFPTVWSEDSADFSAGNSHSASDLSAKLSVPYEDIVQLEWLSTFVEDSFSGGGLTLDKSYTTFSDNNKDSFQTQFQSSSPISVLESNSSTSSSKILPVSHEKRARSKRPRPASFTPRAPFELIGRAVGHPAPVSSSESGNCTEAKKRKIKIMPVLARSDETNHEQTENPNESGPVRKCLHCAITKTPQWRAGPMGPKTLCNACGVRHKSGRLYPEYRPAASPTFVPSLHSNSHKKVLEMRGVTVEGPKHAIKAGMPPSRKLGFGPKSGPVGPYM